MFGFRAPTQLEVVKSEAIKTQLIRELQISINEVHSLAVITEGPLSQSDIVNQLLFVFEAIFLHESKDYLSSKSFWPFLKGYLLHKDVFEQLRKLTFVNTDVGRCRAWVRIALADHLFESYLRCIAEDSKSIERFYRRTALLRDVERMKILITLAQGLFEVQFNLALNAALLNKWPRQPLLLAGIMSPETATSITNTLTPVQPAQRPVASSETRTSAESNSTTGYKVHSDREEAAIVANSDTDLNTSSTLTRVMAVESATDASALANSLLADSLVERAARENQVTFDATELLNSILELPIERQQIEQSRIVAEEQDMPIAVTVSRRQHIVVASEALDLVQSDDSSAVDVAFTEILELGTNETNAVSVSVKPEPPLQEVKNNETENADEENSLSNVAANTLNDLNTLNVSESSSSDNVATDNLSNDVNMESNDVRNDATTHNAPPETQPTEPTNLATEDYVTQTPTDAQQNSSEAVEESAEKQNHKSAESVSDKQQLTIEENESDERQSNRDTGHTSETYSALLRNYRRHSNSLSMQLDWANDDSLDESSGSLVPQKSGEFDPKESGRRRGLSASAATGNFASFSLHNSDSSLSTLNRPSGVSPAQIACEGPLDDADSLIDSAYELLVDVSECKPSKVSWYDGRQPVTVDRVPSGFTYEILTIVQKEKGLDEQSFKCSSCDRPLIPGSASTGKRRLDFFDGCSYCFACHLNDVSLIPARILNCWDLKPYPVARGTKRLIERHARTTLIELNDRVRRLSEQVASFRRLEQQRLQLFYLRAYLFTCRANVAEQFRSMANHREYLFDRVHVYSIADLFDAAAGRLQAQLSELVRFGENHVAECALCRERGFVCEICKRKEVIFPFQVARTEICTACRGVFHKECKLGNTQRPCPRCHRKEEREKLLLSSQADESLNLSDRTETALTDSSRPDDELDFIL